MTTLMVALVWFLLIALGLAAFMGLRVMELHSELEAANEELAHLRASAPLADVVEAAVGAYRARTGYRATH